MTFEEKEEFVESQIQDIMQFIFELGNINDVQYTIINQVSDNLRRRWCKISEEQIAKEKKIWKMNIIAGLGYDVGNPRVIDLLNKE